MYEFKCPHCETVLYKTELMTYDLGDPIRTCPNCNKEYNHSYTYEWSIISPFHKFYYCFLANCRFLFPMFIFTELSCQNWILAIITTILWLTISILRFRISDSDNVKQSYQRTKNNPEYIQKLSDLGCTSIDIRIDPYYK